MDFGKLKEFRKALDRLAAQIRVADADSIGERAPVELDQQAVGRLSRMDALQVQAMAMETSRRRATELRRITAALVRIDEGEFGYCLKCGDEIAARRIELDPATPLCIGCASGK
ncbi:MAG TPA: TraR/DksA C4-type zinc finger protein [Thermohalobaculum sp.]|nr:TraR/DksA C4-type zinc finger protein [Thermohalobaculum sp.]